MMNFMQIQTYVGLWAGATAMISLHNTVVSFFLYKARQSNVSNILKMVFNFANFVRFLGGAGLYMTPQIATILQCRSLQYSILVGNYFARVPIAAFLLWRLRQIDNNRTDFIVGIILMTFRAGLGVVPFFFQRPGLYAIPGADTTICSPNESTSKVFTIAMIAVEFLIDIYVSVRLYQILRKANKNAAQISSNMGGAKSKRTLFTAVMYWNFLRLAVSVVFHISPLLYFLDEYDEARNITTQCLINIVLSYVITVDAEIVRVIEGKDKKKKGSSTDSDKSKSFKSMSQSPRSPHYAYSPDLPKYSAQDASPDDQDKLVVSMKRLSFFEWANVVVGKRLRRNNDEIEEDDEVEEIIEDDIEKGPSQNRDSNFSGTTSTTATTATTETESTLDGNPEVVVNTS